MKARILVADDEPAVRSALRVNLGKAGYSVDLVDSAEAALERLDAEPYDLLLTDVRMPGRSGLDLIGLAKRCQPHLQVVVMTGFGSVTDAVAAMREGACDYAIKPIERDELLVILGRALENQLLRQEIGRLRQEVRATRSRHNLIGTTPVMERLYADLEAIANTSATVLIEGPTGTGKELVAHALHQQSARSAQPYVRINCGAIPESLIESELFGHERGAFSGAIRQHAGRFEQAHRGTLLLDEIGELELHLQVKLLRVLESGEFQRVGGTDTLHVDVRVIAATNRDLRVEVAEGRFREDLYYRLNVMALQVPPLADRVDDIPLLVEHFARKYAGVNELALPAVAPDDMARLLAYPWPGNVRQLEHVVERGVILQRAGTLAVRLPDEAPVRQAPAAAVAAGTALPSVGVSLQEALLEHERALLIAALREAKGVQAQAARRLGISRSNLSYRMQRLGLQVVDVSYD